MGWLSAIFQLIYILLALPAGRWLDRTFAGALRIGAVMLAVGAVLRVLAPQSFALQLAGQVAVAVSQPLVLNALTGTGTRYFPEAERPTAVAIGSASIFVGILLATQSSPALYASGGLARVLLVQAMPAVLGAAWLLALLRVPPPYPAPTSGGGGLAWLRRDRFMWRLGGLLVLGFGIFIALSTWMEAIFGFYGVNSVVSGTLLGVMVFAGILGSAVLPLMVAALLVCGIALAATAWRHGVAWLGAWLFVTGFFLLATLPVVLEWAERHAGPARPGRAQRSGF